MNELPDLAERIQVGLLNILEERDVQVRGFTIRLPLDLLVVASANPEDYTSRGRIITPLKDRLGSQIRTHYPRSLEHEIAIVRQEKQRVPRAGRDPARRDARVHGGARRRAHPPRPAVARDQPAERRVGARLGRQHGGARGGGHQAGRPARASRWRRRGSRDLGAVLAATTGKVEVETVGEDTPEERIVERLVTKAVFATFNRRASLDRLSPVIEAFEDGLVIETG